MTSFRTCFVPAFPNQHNTRNPKMQLMASTAQPSVSPGKKASPVSPLSPTRFGNLATSADTAILTTASKQAKPSRLSGAFKAGWHANKNATWKHDIMWGLGWTLASCWLPGSQLFVAPLYVLVRRLSRSLLGFTKALLGKTPKTA
jgi:hypothetical protein